jgi:hypothetical protein
MVKNFIRMLGSWLTRLCRRLRNSRALFKRPVKTPWRRVRIGWLEVTDSVGSLCWICEYDGFVDEFGMEFDAHRA